MHGVERLRTPIDVWNNNHKGTDYMWATLNDLGFQDDLDANLCPKYIEVRGKGGASYSWKMSHTTHKTILGIDCFCVVYLCSENYCSIRAEVGIIKLYLVLRS